MESLENETGFCREPLAMHETTLNKLGNPGDDQQGRQCPYDGELLEWQHNAENDEAHA